MKQRMRLVGQRVQIITKDEIIDILRGENIKVVCDETNNPDPNSKELTIDVYMLERVPKDSIDISIDLQRDKE